MKGPAIEVTGLQLRLGGSLVLRDMDFAIASGELHCFVGPNGGGKTSTLRCLLGQMPHEGSIRIDWYDEGPIGYVPQLLELERGLPLTVEDFLVLAAQERPAFLRRQPAERERLAALLTRVGLGGKAGRPLAGLSGGERQRLLLAQALDPEPALLLLDEPLSGLDSSGAALFEELIVAQQRRGTTVIWVNHDLEQVARLAQRITVIDGGVVAHGGRDEHRAFLDPGAFHRLAMQGGL